MNITNMLALADRVEASPETYDQMHWCGSAYCLAGHAAHMAGWLPTTTSSRYRSSVYESPDVSGGKSADVVAREFLGLTSKQANQLFSGGWQPCLMNSIRSVPDQLRRYASGEDSIL